jgi:hypothetical protein
MSGPSAAHAAIVAVLLIGCAVPGQVFDSDAGRPEPPTWSVDQARWSWRRIEGSSLAAVPGLAGAPSAAARIDAWAGMAVDERTATIYVGASGGDWTYPGNEVVALSLGVDAPRWTVLMAPTPLDLTTLGQPYYSDGHPASRQVHYRSVFVERRGRLLLLGGDVAGSVELQNLDAFDPVAAAWDPPESFPNLPFVGDGEEPAIAEDPDTGNVWIFGNAQVHCWIEATNRWAAVVPGGLMQSGYGLAAAMDTRRHRILLVGAERGDVFTFSIDDLTWTSTETVVGPAHAAGLVFVRGATEGDDVFLLRTAEAGPHVLAIDPETLAPVELTPTGGEAIPVAANGVFGRFRAAPTLGGVVFYPRHDDDVWFLRTAP